MTSTCEICKTPTDHQVMEKTICPDCAARISDYQDRVKTRLERLQARADKERQAAQADINRAHTMAQAIPFGQPIILGHHSERRDRNYRDRIERTFRRGYKRLQHAQNITERTAAAESNTAIYTDDPAAVIQMRDKITALEAAQEWMKRVNRVIRKAQRIEDKEAQIAFIIKELEIQEDQARSLLGENRFGDVGIPTYRMQNNNSNLRRCRQRLAELEQRAAIIAQGVAVEEKPVAPGVMLVRDVEANRLRLVFDEKPKPEVRKLLKSWGFRWAPSEGAWQQHLSPAAEHKAQMVIQNLPS